MKEIFQKKITHLPNGFFSRKFKSQKKRNEQSDLLKIKFQIVDKSKNQ